MCGIIGLSREDRKTAGAMLESLRHRGPDDSGIYTDGKFTLGHVRLSVLDLSEAGHQPMCHEGLVLVFNGEIYNYREIRQELETEYSFDSDTDSEVVLKAFHKWGSAAVDRFVGMFAFAIYDTEQSVVWLFRDRVGVKPLYYYFDGEEFGFASETQALKVWKKDLKVDEGALCGFFRYGYISSGRSIYGQVRKVPPGHGLRFDLKSRELTEWEYWSIAPFFRKPKFQKSEEELVDELEALLIDSFRYRMVSDVPVGVFLSGGIDSSVVAAILQRHYGTIHTFTIGFAEARYNEAEWARKVAEHLGTRHTERYLTSADAGEILKHFVDIYDEPFGDSSGIPTSLVSRVAKEAGVKVVLSADGGDEIFCGYDRYWVAYGVGKKVLALPRFLRLSLAKVMQGVGVDRVSRLFRVRNIAHKYTQFGEILREDDWRHLYEDLVQSDSRDHLRRLAGCDKREEDGFFEVGAVDHPMQGMMLWDYHRYLPDDILVKVDRATMYHSIEGREPLLDHRIAEFMAQVPFEYKYRDGTGKYLLRKVLERYLPEALIDRPKMGFGIPMFEWFGGELKTLFHRYFRGEDPLVDMEYVREELARFERGAAINVNLLWFVLVYRMWRERYLG